MLLIWKFIVNVLRSGFCLLWGRERTTHKIVQCKVQVRSRPLHGHFPVFKPNVCLCDFPEFVVPLDLFLSAFVTVMTGAQAISRFICVCAPMPTQSSTLQMPENSLKGRKNSKTFLQNIPFLLVLISGAQLHRGIMIVRTERPHWFFWGVLHQRKPHLQGSTFPRDWEDLALSFLSVCCLCCRTSPLFWFF